jgi:hypothetical protein
MIDLLGNKNTEFAAVKHCDKNCLKIKTGIIKTNLCSRSRLCERVERVSFARLSDLITVAVFGILAKVTMQIIFSRVTPCSVVEIYHLFGRTIVSSFRIIWGRWVSPKHR